MVIFELPGLEIVRERHDIRRGAYHISDVVNEGRDVGALLRWRSDEANL
jgi:hypothetical protein